jgi:hypothetical protein
MESITPEIAMVACGSTTESQEDKKSRMADYPFCSIANFTRNRKHHFSERRGIS